MPVIQQTNRLGSMRSAVLRIAFALVIAAGAGIAVNYTPLHDITVSSGRISLPGIITASAALLVLTLHTIGFGIIARREAVEERPLSLGLWVTFFFIATIVAFSIGMRFAADEIRSFGGNGVLPPVAEALSLFDEPLSHSLLIVGWMTLVLITVIVELRNPSPATLSRRDRDIAIAGGAVAGAIGALAVIEGQVWWIALPVAAAFAALALWQAQCRNASLWHLPMTLFGVFGFFALAAVVSAWGITHNGFPEVRDQPFRFLRELRPEDVRQFQEQLEGWQRRLLQELENQLNGPAAQ